MRMSPYLPTATENAIASPRVPIALVLTVRNAFACASIAAAYTALVLRDGFIYFPTMYSLLAVMATLAVGAAAWANVVPFVRSVHRRHNPAIGAVAIIPAACIYVVTAICIGAMVYNSRL